MKQMKTVIVETYLRQIKSWTFLALVFAPILMAGFIVLMSELGANSAKDKPIALVADSQFAQVINTADTFEVYTDDSKAKKAYDKEDLEGYITVTSQDGQVQATYHGTSSLSESDQVLLNQGLMTLQGQLNQAQAGLTADQTKTLSRQPIFQEKLADSSVSDKKMGQQISFYGLTFILYFLLLIYASVTAQEIASEKGTKIMEVIFSSIESQYYFYGRILGIFAAILTHIGIYVLAVVVSLPFLKEQDFIKPYQGLLDAVLGQINWMVVLFVILALIFYVVLSAFSGSLVSRAEDASKAVQPLIYLVILCFFLVITLGQGGDTLSVKILSYFPLTSPFFMPLRLINEQATVVEGSFSLLLLLLSVIGIVIYIGRHYAGLILQTDDLGLLKSMKRGLSHK